MNTTTKPLFEETLNIVFECFEKHKKGRPLLPIDCLKNYQLIYDENNDSENLLRDDNQVFSERTSSRYSIRDTPSRLHLQRTLPRIGTSRTSMTTITVDSSVNTEILFPLVNELNSTRNFVVISEAPEPIKSSGENVDNERKVKPRYSKTRYSYARPVRSLEPATKTSVKRTLSSHNLLGISRTKRIDLKPIIVERKPEKPRNHIISTCIELEKKENTMIVEEPPTAIVE